MSLWFCPVCGGQCGVIGSTVYKCTCQGPEYSSGYNGKSKEDNMLVGPNNHSNLSAQLPSHLNKRSEGYIYGNTAAADVSYAYRYHGSEVAAIRKLISRLLDNLEYAVKNNL